jgi:hypothetical protein
MLRHRDLVVPLLAALWVGGVVACGSAAPVDVGTAIVEPEVPLEAVPDEDLSGQMSLDPVFDQFLDVGWERGEVNDFCRSSFQACGGLLAGTWQVEDNCNPVIRTRDVLLQWGKARMDLDETACWDAVQRLRWNWTGQLRFEQGLAIDEREREQVVDMQLTARCLSATLGTPPADSVSPETCDGLQNESTTCALSAGVCLCSNRSVSSGTASGVYGVLGLSVAIQLEKGSPTNRYEYCVNGDSLLWKEKDGDLRQVVMKRIVDPAEGETDPIEIPR